MSGIWWWRPSWYWRRLPSTGTAGCWPLAQVLASPAPPTRCWFISHWTPSTSSSPRAGRRCCCVWTAQPRWFCLACWLCGPGSCWRGKSLSPRPVNSRRKSPPLRPTLPTKAVAGPGGSTGGAAVLRFESFQTFGKFRPGGAPFEPKAAPLHPAGDSGSAGGHCCPGCLFLCLPGGPHRSPDRPGLSGRPERHLYGDHRGPARPAVGLSRHRPFRRQAHGHRPRRGYRGGYGPGRGRLFFSGPATR